MDGEVRKKNMNLKEQSLKEKGIKRNKKEAKWLLFL